ncbi:MAG: protein NO VEIN domain-containing protein, partial [Saprospiraceae bacterium]
FEQIGYFQFHWFSQMANSEHFRYEFAGLLVKYTENNIEPRNQSLNTGVNRAQNEVSFVPVLQSDELKKAPETIVDKTRFSDGLGEYQLVRDSFEPDVRYEIADPRIKRIERLLSVGAAKFDPQKLRDAIRRGRRFATVPDNVRLLNFFHQKLAEISDTGERNEWMQVLYETPFLLDQDGALKEPGTLYFPTGLPELPFELPMDFLHDEVFGLGVVSNTALSAWLEKLGVAYPKPGEIIRRGIFSLIENEQVNLSNAVAIGRYIFKNYESLTPDDFQKLSQLPLLTTRNSLLKACFCYLPDVFVPKLPLESLLDEDIFVSKNYLVEGDEPGAWNRFLSKCGARQEMELILEERFFPVNLEIKNRFGEYWNFLQTHLPQFNRKAAHSLFTFLSPLYIRYAERYDFSVAYWKILLGEKWRELVQKSDRARFVYSGGKATIPSYFQFLVQTKPYFPATDGKCYPTVQVYSATLSDLVGDWAPVSNFELTPQQEELLGIRSKLSLEDCFSILLVIADHPEKLDKERLTGLYKYMLTQRFQAEDMEACPLFGDDFKLLAINNTFQPVGQLLFLHVPRFAEKSDSPHFVFLDLEEEAAIGFCKLFGLAVVGLKDLRLASKPFEGTIDSDVFPSDWQSKLPFIATISAAKKGQSYQHELERLTVLSKDIHFKPSASLKLTLEKDESLIYQKDVQAWREGNGIFYLHDWQDVRTLFDLQEVLATCFEIEGCERELGLLLSIKTELIPAWLLEQGYSIPDSIELPESAKSRPEAPAKPVVKVPVGQAKTVQPAVTAPKKPSYSPIRGKDALEIGRWGEEYIREKEIIGNYYREHGMAFTEIEWMNGPGESSSPFDFKVKLETGEVHFWEVKSTPSATKAEYLISGNEFQHALRNEDAYFIIRILAAGTDMPNCKILENPVQLIREGVIRINEMKMEIKQ